VDLSSETVQNITKVVGPVLFGVWRGIRQLVKSSREEKTPGPAKERPSSPRLRIPEPKNEGDDAEVSTDEYNKLCHDVETLKRNVAQLRLLYERMERDYQNKLDAIEERLEQQTRQFEQLDRNQRNADNRLAGIQGELKGIGSTIREMFQMVQGRVAG
jgi:predicted RNase H-like nuclease (RuvC/YqgF family)